MVNGQRSVNTRNHQAPTSYRLSPLSTKPCITFTPCLVVARCGPCQPVMAMKLIPGITEFSPGEDSLRKKDMKNSSRRRDVDNVDNSKNHREQKENSPANFVGKLSTYPQGRWITCRNAGGTWTATRPLRCPSTRANPVANLPTHCPRHYPQNSEVIPEKAQVIHTLWKEQADEISRNRPRFSLSIGRSGVAKASSMAQKLSTTTPVPNLPVEMWIT